MAYLLHGSKLAASRQVARVLKNDPDKGEALLHELCDQLLCLEKESFYSSESSLIEWLKVLFDEEGYEEFCSKVSNMDSSSLCGCVWTAHFVAYRCRTCATSPCMSLCAACFEKGNHDGHDYNIFRSEAGGACDCGDASVMSSSGFCSRHGPNRVPPQPLPPRFLDAAKVVLERLFLTIIHLLRNYWQNVTNHPQTKFEGKVKDFLNFVLELSKLGSPIRSHATMILLDESLYSEVMQCKRYKYLQEGNSSQSHLFHKQTIKFLKDAIKSTEFRSTYLDHRYCESDQLRREYQCKNYLDEIMFWIIKYSFPEPLILVVLNLLPDTDMKREFSKCFTRHYTLLAASLSQTSNVDQLSNRVVHISVQLFSNDDLAYMLSTEEDLLRVFMTSVHHIVSSNLIPSSTSKHDFHNCVSCSSQDMKSNSYWPIVTDFVNVISHEKVARLFLSNYELLQSWFGEVLGFCGMSLSQRAFDAHVEYEPEASQILLSFYTEKEACASPLWCMLAVFKDESTAELCISVIQNLREVLLELFESLGHDASHDLPFDQISFHYPLHRYLAHFLSNAIERQGVTFDDLQIYRETAILLMAHPLQVLTTSHEIGNDMWVRNGMHKSSQSLAYRQHSFCKFFIDADIYIIQFCVCILSPDYVVASVFGRCRVYSSLKLCDVALFNPPSYRYRREDHPDENMLQAAFTILHQVLAVRCQLGLSEEDLLGRELVALLVARSSTYSSLSDHIPQSHDSHTGSKVHQYTALFNKVLEKYSTKKEGMAMEQTTYSPNAEAWKHYDPVFTQYRMLYKRETQQAHARYVQYLKTTRKIDPSASETDLWPPYQPMHEFTPNYKQLGGLLHSRVLHGLIFIVLHNHATVKETTLMIALHILEAALRIRTPPELHLQPDDKWLYDEWYAPIRDLFDTPDPYTNMLKIVSFHKPSNWNANGVIFKDGTLADEESKVYTGESIVTLLIKLFNKYHGQKSSFSLNDEQLRKGSGEEIFRPSTPVNVLSNLLHLAASNSKAVEQMIRVVCKSMSPPVSVSPTPSGSTSSSDERALRRKKAKEAKERLMMQFKQKQQHFIERADMELIDSETPMSSSDYTATDSSQEVSPSDWGLATLPEQECVICGQVEIEIEASPDPSQAEDKLLGMICFVQPSAVLGHRTDSPKNLSLHKLSGLFKSSTADCRYYVSRRNQCWKSLQSGKHVSPDKFREQNLLATAVGSHVSTCGHTVHHSCITKYVESGHEFASSMLARGMPRAFKCPLCRQISNIVLPCNIRPKQKSCEGVPDHRSLISKVWLETHNDLTTITRSATLGAVLYPGSESNHSNLLASLVRHNVENHLMQIKHSLKQSEGRDSGSPGSSVRFRKLPIGPLFIYFLRVRKFRSRRESIEEQTAQIQGIRTRLTEDTSSQSNDPPLLLNDPVTLLLQLCIEGPLLLSAFQANVQLLFPLVFVQALINISCKFSPEERRAWKNNVGVSLGGIPFSPESLQCLMGTVIRLLPFSFYDANWMATSQTQAYFPGDGYSTTVFSPQSVSSDVEETTINFLQLSALLQYHIFNMEEVPITSSANNQFGHLAAYLGLCKPSEADKTDAVKCLKWDKPKNTITRWCMKMSSFYRTSPEISRKLLTSHKPWVAPKLIDLPHEYSTLFQTYSKKECRNCKKVSKEAALCIICGELLCFNSDCAPTRADYTDDFISISNENSPARLEFRSCCHHAMRCGAGTCILLVIQTCNICVIRGTRACMWGSVYLDAHGEVDRGWRRGKPLFLKKERLELLESQWINHSFDSNSVDWGVHGNVI